ncbi:MAG: CRISPR system precrRNA processing endoribonuclease RAMP protein Cas6 [Methylococcaceae bacterium]
MFNDRLKLSKYRFMLEAMEKITLPSYKGSTFHGGFGHALMQISPIWYRYFFEPGLGKKGDWPKPFVILPPLDVLESYPKGYQFHCDLTLFGEATQHYAIAQAAIEYLGTNMGLGYEQGKYKIVDIVHSQPSDRMLQHNNQITLHLPTRLRLKSKNRLYKRTPAFQLIMERLLGRLKTLEKIYMDKEMDDYQALITCAKDIKIKNSNIQWDEWERFSGSQKKWMKYGGLVGSVSYSGDVQPFLEVLKMGEWLHIGGKTSFGLGKYVLEIEGSKL